MSVTSVTLAGQAAALQLMTDTCTVTRGAVNGAYLPASRTYAPAASSTVYSGPCRVKVPRQNVVADTPTAGDKPVAVTHYALWLPITADVALGDVVTLTASQLNPAAVGVTFEVIADNESSQTTSRRVLVKEVGL